MILRLSSKFNPIIGEVVLWEREGSPLCDVVQRSRSKSCYHLSVELCARRKREERHKPKTRANLEGNLLSQLQQKIASEELGEIVRPS